MDIKAVDGFNQECSIAPVSESPPLSSLPLSFPLLSLSLPTIHEVIFFFNLYFKIFSQKFFSDMLKLLFFLLSSYQKHNVEPKRVIGLSSQISEHYRRSQEFG